MKGYEADNPNIELLRLRSFTMGRRLPDSDILDSKYINTVAETIQLMLPFVSGLPLIVVQSSRNGLPAAQSSRMGDCNSVCCY